MEKNVPESPVHPSSAEDARPALTPHQLYNHHLLHPNEPITDDDIRNLKIDSGGVYNDHQVTDGQVTAGTITEEESTTRDEGSEDNVSDAERPKASPYDILGG